MREWARPSAIDLRNGRLALAWQEQELSNSYITLIGPKDNRVFVGSNIKPNEGVGVTQLNGGPDGANYTSRSSGGTQRPANSSPPPTTIRPRLWPPRFPQDMAATSMTCSTTVMSSR